MLEQLRTGLSSQGFIPHGHCYLWKTGLVWLHVTSDAVIALSYFSIPLTLLYFISKRKDVPFNWIFWMFGAFIVACGTGHIMDIWTLWHPTYWAAGVVKALTALISLVTALELIPLVPKALALPSPAQLEATNHDLEAAMQKLQQMQLQLIQTEKMSSLGQLVAGIAHEINNPINFIHGNLNYARDYAHNLLGVLSHYQQVCPQLPAAVQAEIDQDELDFLSDDLPKTLSSMQIGTDRIRQLVLSLRSFSRLDESEQKPVNLHDGIDSTLLILQHRIKPNSCQLFIQVIKEYGELPLVECYPGQLNQVFMNILSNAIEALEEKVAQLELAEVTEFSPEIRIQTRLVNSEHVAIKISDNGLGMSEQTHHKIFNPFFTTKAVGKGTGLGLSICHQVVVDRHGGSLNCVSTVGQGTTFTVQIPLRQPTATKNRQETPSSSLRSFIQPG